MGSFKFSFPLSLGLGQASSHTAGKGEWSGAGDVGRLVLGRVRKPTCAVDMLRACTVNRFIKL